jgi:hypothetical protein
MPFEAGRIFLAQILTRGPDGSFEAGDQRLLLQEFGQITKCAVPQYARANCFSVKVVTKDDWYSVTIQNQATLQLDATHPWQIHVGNQDGPAEPR